MAKLFITLAIVIAVSIALFIFLIIKVTEPLLSNTIASYDHTTFKGSVALLDDEIADLDAEQRREALIAINALFGYPVELHELDALDLTPGQADILSRGSTASHEIDGASYLYSASRHADLVWLIGLEQTQQAHGHRQAIGTFELVQRRLHGKDPATQDLTIKELAPLFGFPITVLSPAQSDFTEAEQDRLSTGQIVIRNFDENYEHYFMRLRDTDRTISAGPFDYPRLLVYMPALVIFFLALLILTPLWLWLRPLWRDLQGLRTASLQIASGNLDTRITATRTTLIGSVIKGFNHMADRTQNMIASQKELTNAVSHELRTPVARLKFGLENLRNATSDADRNRHVNDMAFDVNELDTLLSELLTYARYESGRPSHDLQQQALVPWLDQHIERAKRQDTRCTIEYQVNDLTSSETAAIQPLLLGRALSNALQNAIKHARSQVSVTLSRHDSNYLLQIDDDGPGIPESHHERVFEPFTRVDESRNRSSGGFGLGLPIVAQVARWHGGSARITNSALGGVCLQIRWPHSSA